MYISNYGILFYTRIAKYVAYIDIIKITINL